MIAVSHHRPIARSLSRNARQDPSRTHGEQLKHPRDRPYPAPPRQPDRQVSPRMIAQLTGRIDQLAEGSCIVDVNGVGYLVHASTRTLAALPAPPAAARLLIETHVRGGAIVLYGFAEAAERDWFRLLTTVQGVGEKVA